MKMKYSQMSHTLELAVLAGIGLLPELRQQLDPMDYIFLAAGLTFLRSYLVSKKQPELHQDEF